MTINSHYVGEMTVLVPADAIPRSLHLEVQCCHSQDQHSTRVKPQAGMCFACTCGTLDSGVQICFPNLEQKDIFAAPAA